MNGPQSKRHSVASHLPVEEERGWQWMVTTPRTPLGREDWVCVPCNNLHIFAFACVGFQEGDPLQDFSFRIRFSRRVQRIRAWRNEGGGRKRNSVFSPHPPGGGGGVHASGQQMPEWQSL